jgi:pectate lyase
MRATAGLKNGYLMAAWAATGLLMLAVGGACDMPRNPPPPPPPPPGGNPNPAPAPANTALVGFAAVNSLGQNGTTGGAGGPTVTARTAQEFIDFIARPGPMTVRVEGMLRLPGPLHDVASNKTIVGVGARSGIFGAGLMIGLRNSNASLPANAIRNVIVRNLAITDCPDDCINVQEFSHHIWIDHNDFSRQVDGALDIKRGSDFITVSWNHFFQSDKNALLGHSDNNAAQDVGRLKVTYHHNWFDGTVQRNPRVRFGEPVHVFNNYYFNVSSYGVASQQNAGVLVEGNFFENTKRPTRNDVGGTTGRIVQRMNVFVNSDPPFSAGTVMEPSRFYSYRLDPTNNVPSQVRAGAGVGKIGL